MITTLTVNDVLDYDKIIKEIIDNIKDLDSLVKFRLLGLCKQFEPIVTSYDLIRNEKIIQYGNVEADGQIGIVEPNRENFDDENGYAEAMKTYSDSVNKFQNELKELLKSDANIEIKKIKYSDIMDSNIPGNYLLAIYDLIEE